MRMLRMGESEMVDLCRWHGSDKSDLRLAKA